MQGKNRSAPLRIQNPEPCGTGHGMLRMRILGGKRHWLLKKCHVVEKGWKPKLRLAKTDHYPVIELYKLK